MVLNGIAFCDCDLFTSGGPKYVSTVPYASSLNFTTMSISGSTDLTLPKLSFTFSKAPKYPAESSSQSPKPSPTSSIPLAGLSRPFRRPFAAKSPPISTASISDHQDGGLTSLNRDDFSPSASMTASTPLRPVSGEGNHDDSTQISSPPDSVLQPTITAAPSQDAHATMTSIPPNDLRLKGSSIMQERIFRLKQQRGSDSGGTSSPKSGSTTAHSWKTTASYSKPLIQPRSTSTDPSNGDSSMTLDQMETKPLFSSVISGASLSRNALPFQTDPLPARTSVSASPLSAFMSSPSSNAPQLSVFADALRSAESWMLENQKMVRTNLSRLKSISMLTSFVEF